MTHRGEGSAAKAHSFAGVCTEIDVPEGAAPNHHLWQNGRLWWIAFTVHQGHRQERIRLSLGTSDVGVARQRRDEMFALFSRAEDLKVSLRFGRPARRRAVQQGA